MRFHLRKRLRLWPFYWNFTERGFTSWGIKVGRLSRNFTRGTTTLDIPGPGYLRSRRRRSR